MIDILQQQSSALAEAENADVISYLGPIDRSGYLSLSDLCKTNDSSNDKVKFVLATYGGSPDCAYRIARALSHHYERIEILIPYFCKSAGTLICIGADELIISDTGELGPLDIQLRKRDEIAESASGLDIQDALDLVQLKAFNLYKEAMINLKVDIDLSTAIASKSALELATKLFAPIMAQVDPQTLGEVQRAMSIGEKYGSRLNIVKRSLKQAGLPALLNGYPSHSFVIDRKEAKNIFNNVRAPNPNELILLDTVNEIACNSMPSTATVNLLSSGVQQQGAKNDESIEKSNTPAVLSAKK